MRPHPLSTVRAGPVAATRVQVRQFNTRMSGGRSSHAFNNLTHPTGTNLVAQLVFTHRRTGAAVSGWTPGRGAWLAIRIKVCGLRVAGLPPTG